MRITTRFLVILIVILSHFHGTALSIWTDAILYVVIVMFSLIVTSSSYKEKVTLKINIPELFFILFVFYLILNNVSKGMFWENERLLNYLVMFSLYFALTLLYGRDKKFLNYIFYGIIISIFLEIAVGFGQIFGIVPNADSQFVLGGMFGNPGAYAGYLAIVAPFIFAIVLFYKGLFSSENFYYTLILCLVSAVFLIIISDSRGAWVALFAGFMVILNYKFRFLEYTLTRLKSTASKLLTGVFVIVGIVLILFVLYEHKPESAFGRLLIWKVSKEMAVKAPILGQGYGAFEANYGKTQAQYFAENNAPLKEIAVADYVTCAYNEFLEILIESGIIGLILFASILYFAFVKHCRPIDLKYCIAAKASLIALFILSLVSYPFRLLPNQLVFVCFLLFIFRTANFNTYSIVNGRKILITLWLSCVLCLSFFYGKYLFGMYHFRNGYFKVLSGNIDIGIKDYEKAYKSLQNNREFFFYYGSAFYLKQDYAHSIEYLKKATELTSNPNAFITLGNSLKELERYAEAEQAYKTASGITPSKLYPKYLLAQLYIKMQNTEKALEMASSIVKSVEKVPTTAGLQIKEEMLKMIDQYNKPDVKPLKTNIMSP